MSDMRRENERVQSAVRVFMDEDGSCALTRDISPAGVFILTDAGFKVGQALRFSLEFDNPSGRGEVLYVDCVGEIVRVENADGSVGVAARILESKLERREKRRVPATVAAINGGKERRSAR